MKSKRYAYVSTDIKTVMENIEEFVIPENRAIIEYLWDHNILTTQTNNYENDYSWIQIGKLSEENRKIFYGYANAMSTKEETKEPKVSVVRGFSVPVIPGTRDTFEDFKPLVDLLKPQDVQKDGYITIEEFYINYTDCWDLIDNPEYHPLPEPNYEDYSDPIEFGKAYDMYAESMNVRRRIKVVDEGKITKPIEEYLDEAGFTGCYDEEEGKIFNNKRLYEGHMRYKNMEEPKKHL